MTKLCANIVSNELMAKAAHAYYAADARRKPVGLWSDILRSVFLMSFIIDGLCARRPTRWLPEHRRYE
jgi:hypothetical protein